MLRHFRALHLIKKTAIAHKCFPHAVKVVKTFVNDAVSLRLETAKYRQADIFSDLKTKNNHLRAGNTFLIISFFLSCAWSCQLDFLHVKIYIHCT